MNTKPMKQKEVYQLIRDSVTCVLSTVTADNASNSAIVYFHFDAMEGVFSIASREDTAKARNIVQNPKVSLVIHPTKSPYEIQLLGEAKIVKDNKDVQSGLSKVLRVVAGDSDYTKYMPPVLAEADSPIVLINVVPTHIKVIDASKLAPRVVFDFSSAVAYKQPA